MNLEFVDTLELIPDSWSSYEEEFQCCHHLCPSQWHHLVTNILQWVARLLCCHGSHPSIKLSTQDDGFNDVPMHNNEGYRSFLRDRWITYDIVYNGVASLDLMLGYTSFYNTLCLIISIV